SLRLYLFVTDPATTEIYTLSLHDALPISNFDSLVQKKRIHMLFNTVVNKITDTDVFVEVKGRKQSIKNDVVFAMTGYQPDITLRSEEHTSELQSRFDLVCRLLLEKKKQQT